MTTFEIVLTILISILIISVGLLLFKVLSNKKDDKDINSSILDATKNAIHFENSDQEQRILNDNERIKTEIKNIQNELSEKIINYQSKINESISSKFSEIDTKLNNKMTENYNSTKSTIEEVNKQLLLINETQKNLINVESSIDSFKEILSGKKSRGSFGEFQLNTILEDLFGGYEKYYDIQYTFDNGLTVDAVIKLPSPIGIIPIDSKFPLENYKKMYDTELNEQDRKEARKAFKIDVKNHIDKIESQYIIKDVTTDQAIMFIPSEAIFAEIYANYNEVVDYSFKKRVRITSPTTLTAVLQTMYMMVREYEIKNNLQDIIKNLNKIRTDFKTYEERWEKFDKDLDRITIDAKNINNTTKKISKDFDVINKSYEKIEKEKEKLENKEEN